MSNQEFLEDLISKQTTTGREPWDGDGYYPQTSSARHGIYSIGIDRFLLVDKMDLRMTLKCAKILSSKLPTAVFYLGEATRKFETYEALFWSITDKNIYQGGSQTPVLSKIHEINGVEFQGAPLDYQTPEQLHALVDLQNYALFVQRALYAIHYADMICNDDDHFFFARLMKSNVGEIINVRPDFSLATDVGMVIATERILYMAQSIEEATDQIVKLWQDRPQRNDSKFRWLVFHFLGLPQPTVIRPAIPNF
jgi:hypothetical protein